MSRSNLTGRELEVLRLKGVLKTDADIAKELHMSRETVKYQLKWVRIKLNAKNTTHAYAIAFRKGLL